MHRDPRHGTRVPGILVSFFSRFSQDGTCIYLGIKTWQQRLYKFRYNEIRKSRKKTPESENSAAGGECRGNGDEGE